MRWLSNLPGAPAILARLRRPDPTHFLIGDYVALLRGLVDAGVSFEALGPAAVAGASARRVHFLKHDIHHDLVNTQLIARAEAEAGIRSSFFMMPRHRINQKYFDRPETFEVLRKIQELGHQVGLHIDGFAMIEEFGDLYRGVEAARSLFSKEGIELKIANTHGNSSYQARLKLETVAFFKELAERPGAEPLRCEDKFWLEHYARYRLSQMGFELWADTLLWTRQHGLTRCDYYVTDNSTRIKAGDLSTGAFEVVGPKFKISGPLKRRMIKNIKKGSCIWLIHPQFFRPTTVLPSPPRPKKANRKAA
ncbi:MAG: hypothetical protein ACHQAQ_17600 [Hyphomicrobiales bacterium]